MLRHRLVTGVLLIAAMLALCWGDDRLESVVAPDPVGWWFGSLRWPAGSLLFLLLALVALPLAARELAILLRAQGVRASAPLLAVGAVLGAYLIWSPRAVPVDWSLAASLQGPTALGTLLALVLAAALVLLSRGQTIAGVAAGAGGALLATVWLGVLPGFLLALRSNYSAWVVVGVVLTTKSCDIGAYFTGRLIGRHKLIPWLSPGKTWEGLFGGVLLASTVGACLAALSSAAPAAQGSIPAAWGALCGAVFALVGQFGDLGKSLLKRGAGVKDSGSILPGMGGILDVLDSVLAVGPVAWWMLMHLPAW